LFGEREFTWNKIRQQNRNPLLAMGIGADGLKTGFTREAGYGLVGSAVQNSLRLIAVINGAKTPKERADEARKLLEFGFRGFESRPLFVEGQIIGDAKLYGGSAGHVPLVAGQAVNLLVPRNAADRIVARVVYSGPGPAPKPSVTSCSRAPPSRWAPMPRRSCSRPRAMITCAKPSARRSTPADGSSATASRIPRASTRAPWATSTPG